MIYREDIKIRDITAIIWGEKSEKVYIYVHGKMSKKENAEEFARIANSKGYQVISFDLPEHGEREDLHYKCDVWNGISDLQEIYRFSKERWKEINLFACSLGAYFSLLAYKDFEINKCLFKSPILDMKHLINKMFRWFDISEELLREKKEIVTPIDTMKWEYFEFVTKNPIAKWNFPTKIIYGTKDDLQDMSVMTEFCEKFNAELTVAQDFEHFFHRENELSLLYKWVEENV